MTLLEWCKFIRAIKEAAGYTNTEVAEGADVSLSTVESIMSLNRDKDIMRDTARRIENFVLGVGTGYPCYLAFEENLPDVSSRVSKAMLDLERELDEKHLAALDNLRSSHAAEMLAIKTANEADKDAIKAEYDAKVHYLREQIDRLQRENDNLWTEINRKSRIIDRLIEIQEKHFINE
jgi:transcriptional regulator with XRE-family HTH domain